MLLSHIYPKVGGAMNYPASVIAEQGHDIINTNGDWYYVLGRARGNTRDGAKIEDALEKARSTSIWQLPSTTYPKTKIPIIGSMLCVWADIPSKEYQEELVANLIYTFALNNKSLQRSR